MDRHASRLIRHRLWAIVGIFAILATATPASPAFGAEPVEVVFSATGAEQIWVVPANVSSIHVVLIGGNGGDLTSTGFAHVVSGDLGDPAEPTR